MNGVISGNMIGGTAPLKTLKLVDDNGVEIVGVVVGQETIFTASDNDVREGMVYASDSGVSIGTKNIPAYYATYGKKIAFPGQEAYVCTPRYNYSNVLITIANYNTNIDQSLDVMYVSIEDGMYTVSDHTKVADITIDDKSQQIKLGIIVSEKSVLRYSIITEEI